MNLAAQLAPSNISNMIRELGGSKNKTIMKNPTVPYEEFSTERLMDILLNHNCFIEVKNDCDCLIIDEIVEKRSKPY